MQQTLFLNNRLRYVLLSCVALGCAGLFYAYVLIPHGLQIPCFFHLITGLKCPGCGITTMCLLFLHGNFREAVFANLGLTLAIPFLTAFFAATLIRYVKTGVLHKKGIEDLICVGFLVWFLLWFIIRNICGI